MNSAIIAKRVIRYPIYGAGCRLSTGTVKILSQIDRGGLGPALL